MESSNECGAGIFAPIWGYLSHISHGFYTRQQKYCSGAVNDWCGDSAGAVYGGGFSLMGDVNLHMCELSPCHAKEHVPHSIYYDFAHIYMKYHNGISRQNKWENGNSCEERPVGDHNGGQSYDTSGLSAAIPFSSIETLAARGPNGYCVLHGCVHVCPGAKSCP